MSEPPIPSDPAGELLGCDNHPEVVLLAACRETAIGLGDRQSEAADLCEPCDDRFGYIIVGAMYVFCDGTDLVVGETSERCADEIEVIGEM